MFRADIGWLGSVNECSVICDGVMGIASCGGGGKSLMGESECGMVSCLRGLMIL